VFAPGRYDAAENVRVAPICEKNEMTVRGDSSISSKAIYKDTATEAGQRIKRAYHVRYNSDTAVYTDQPVLEDLYGKIISGHTDSALYMLDTESQSLKEITISDAYSMYGPNWEQKVLTLDDAIVYSYRILR